MQMQSSTTRFLLLCLGGLLFNFNVNAQNLSQDELEKTIRGLDSIFWVAYNHCDVDKMAEFLTDDLEFYHDKGGLTQTSAKLVEMTKGGMCGNDGWRLRREEIEGTTQVFPMNNYGAIFSGEHVFYLTEKGKKERLDGQARFTHLWQFKDNVWKMSRVLSYDHGPAVEAIQEKMILSEQILKQYTGVYKAPETGVVSVTIVDDALQIQAGEMQQKIHAASENTFFVEGVPLGFEFVKDADGKVMKMLVREHGEVVEEAIKE